MTTADLCAEWKRLFKAAWAEPFTLTRDGIQYPAVAELMNWQRDHMDEIIAALSERAFVALTCEHGLGLVTERYKLADAAACVSCMLWRKDQLLTEIQLTIAERDRAYQEIAALRKERA